MSLFVFSCNQHRAHTDRKAASAAAQQASSPASPAEAKNLRYVADSMEIRWTAYKTTAKIPVSGTFKSFTFHLNDQAKNPVDLLKNASVDISSATVFSGNEERDKKLWDYFFQMMMETNQIEARVQQVNPSSDQAVIVIRMNNKEIPVTFALTTKDGRLQGDADIDVVKQFHAGRALYHLHTACEQQHTGPDGVSKTWPDVHLTFKVYYHQAK